MGKTATAVANKTPNKTFRRPGIGYDVFMVILSFVSVAILVTEITNQALPGTSVLLGVLDVCIALIFLTDAIMIWRRTPNKRLFWRDQWYVVLSAIPYEATVFQALRGFSVLCLLRVVNLIRFFHVSRRLRHVARNYFEEAVMRFITVGMFVAATIFTGATAFYHFEAGQNSSVQTLFDSIWWAFGMVSTAGSGIYPITIEGRFIAIGLVVVGTGAMGVTVATIANYYIMRRQSSN